MKSSRSFFQARNLSSGNPTNRRRASMSHPRTIWTSAGRPSAVSFEGPRSGLLGTGSSSPACGVWSTHDVHCQRDDVALSLQVSLCRQEHAYDIINKAVYTRCSFDRDLNRWGDPCPEWLVWCRILPRDQMICLYRRAPEVSRIVVRAA
jgi:hypothetical protein